jgi:hypothetical protein
MWATLFEHYLPGAGRLFKWALSESNTKVSQKEFELWKGAFREGHEAGAKRPGNTFQGNFQGDITIKEGGPSKHLGESPTPNTAEAGAGAESGGHSWSWGPEVNDHLLKSAGAGLGAGIVVAIGGATYLGVQVGLAEHERYDEFMRKQWGLPPKGGPDSRKVSRPFHGPRNPGVREGPFPPVEG